MRGVSAVNPYHSRFLLRAFLICNCGDMPACAKQWRMSGHTGKVPRRACKIVGIRDSSQPTATTHYAVLNQPGIQYDPKKLPLQTHENWIAEAIHISSLRFPTCNPHDLMHIEKNIIPMLVDIWTGAYKDLGPGSEDYLWDEPGKKTVLNAIGEACASSVNTIPSSFGCCVPNLATQRSEFIAESWIMFATMLSPAILHNRFKKRVYYIHFMELIRLFNLCMQFGLDHSDIAKLERGFAKWVVEFER
ncbi:hypothetical protein BDV98DRAFT_614530 [Pterulicium gracile]|uniref:Uncharacterized protein n=1 Tax=Pterulicium gracile TaxID=1884261 RepID=A0A5C3Q1N9_9AGAR|nr:hypothetical protein BDV98DRAFT_614530 [Pterula gracilis]